MQATKAEEPRRERVRVSEARFESRLVLVADEISPVIISLSSRGKCIPRTRVASPLLNHKGSL